MLLAGESWMAKDNAAEPDRLLLAHELVYKFRLVCVRLGRDHDDVFSEMMDTYRRSRQLDERQLNAGPPPGPVDDPSQPHAHPFCHNAHQRLRKHRMTKRSQRLDSWLGIANASSNNPRVRAPIRPPQRSTLSPRERLAAARARRSRPIEKADPE